ncbi:MAG: hypothetical protein R3C44_09505 [Chloroflexota bacterium]
MLLRLAAGRKSIQLRPRPLVGGESCTATVIANRVQDADADDPPDAMTQNYSWSFTTGDVAPPADFVIINETDPNTPGTDTTEFIELYDGGQGRTALDGLTVVLFNGNSDLSYEALSLNGYATDANGYFVIGNAAVSGVDLTIANGLIQNGPDAITCMRPRPPPSPITRR